ncbi:response regulator [Engelhardtia mirabilis]|uniref:Response regulator rcp1 n=1 Tax=Engelhardtia mirabilis TaxID=2528011 RepID=A0A518BQW3_9BACT|nr:Response regulator rcp1 [Planctomycetes bacterium Pla133]QDV03699.1 Response regulator rcp1 [Planctomycetes bacterium Pla86]
MKANRPVHFLLVEDEDAHAELLVRGMERERIHNLVTRVRDGEAALEALRDAAAKGSAALPDVVLLDIHLPKVDGLEVLRVIRESEELSHLPVVMLTASNSAQDRERALELNVSSYLQKPLEFDCFRQMVRDLSLYWTVWNRPPAD